MLTPSLFFSSEALRGLKKGFHAMNAEKETKAESTLKLYVYDDNNITFNCPGCGYSKIIDLSKLKNITTEMKIKCKCSAIIKCMIEYRQKYRKKVNLKGSCRDLKTGTKFPVIIKDISLGGISFNYFMKFNIKAGDMVEAIFQLDDPKKTEIRLTGEVKWSHARDAGLKFRDPGGYQKDLGFYLMK